MRLCRVCTEHAGKAPLEGAAFVTEVDGMDSTGPVIQNTLLVSLQIATVRNLFPTNWLARSAFAQLAGPNRGQVKLHGISGKLACSSFLQVILLQVLRLSC